VPVCPVDCIRPAENLASAEMLYIDPESCVVLALSNAGSRIPRIGRFFEDLGSLAALSFWGVKHAPDIAEEVKSRRARRTPAEHRPDSELAPTPAGIASLELPCAEHAFDLTDGVRISRSPWPSACSLMPPTAVIGWRAVMRRPPSSTASAARPGRQERSSQ
jgi:hypothetical protein